MDTKNNISGFGKKGLKEKTNNNSNMISNITKNNISKLDKNALKERISNNSNMILNKKTGRYNNLQTALNNGLLTDRDNFVLPKNTLLLNSKEGYYLRKHTAAYKIKPTEFLVNNDEYIINPKTNRFLLKTDKNVSRVDTYIKNIKKEEKVKRLEEREILREEFKKRNTTIYRVSDMEQDEIPEGMDFVKATLLGLVKDDKNPYKILHKLFKKYIGKTIEAAYIVNGVVVEDRVYEIPETFSSWWSNITSAYHWMVGSGQWIFDAYGYEGKFYIYEKSEILNPEKISQHFKYGVTNCLLTPIKEWCIQRIEDTERKTRDKYEKKLNIINDLLIKYKNGVPESDISNICDLLQVDINIELPFNMSSYINCISNKKALQKFNYINTKLNHVDYITNEDIETVSKEQLNELQQKLNENNEFYVFNTNTEGISSIRTIDKQYILYNDFIDCVNEFELETGLLYCKIDDIKDYELSQFVRAGCHYNVCLDFIDIYKYIDNKYYLAENINNYKHIDIKTAYASYKQCDFYEGFLGKITDFRATDKIEGVGLYQIYDIDFSNADEIFLMYCNKLNIYKDNMIYPSPELKLLDYYNVKYKIKGGCWGVEKLDFDFNNRMLTTQNKNGNKYYAMYGGLCNRDGSIKRFNIKGEYEYAEVLKSNSNKNTRVAYDHDNKYITVSYKKKSSFHLSHITAFLTSYVRIIALQQLLKMDYSKIARIASDGIYFLEHDFNIISPFRYKESECKQFANNASHSYISGAEYYYDFPAYREHHNSELHLGEGGSGKTHFNICDEGLCKKLFVAPTWKLATSKEKEYSVNSTVWARVITDDDTVTNNIKKYYNVLIIDECSMMTNKQKDFLLTTYSDMKIIFCGDLVYQLGPINDNVMNIYDIEYIRDDFGTSKRYKCNELIEVSNYLRTSIRTRTNINIVKKKIKAIFSEKGQYIDNLNYNINDIIITHSNINKDYYTELYKGKFEEEKYYITQTTREVQNGLIVISKDAPNAINQIRHGFTSYSIQGETFYNKIFIDIDDLINLQSLYTTISRAQYLSQIYIIKQSDELKKYKIQNMNLKNNKNQKKNKKSN